MTKQHYKHYSYTTGSTVVLWFVKKTRLFGTNPNKYHIIWILIVFSVIFYTDCESYCNRSIC